MRRRPTSRALAGGDEAEFSAFVARDGGQLLGFAFLLIGNRHDAEDLVQSALLRTAGCWPAARQSPVRYSRTVLLNLVRDRWRVRQRRHAETLSPDLTALPSASDAAAAVLDRQLLLRACRRLPLAHDPQASHPAHPVNDPAMPSPVTRLVTFSPASPGARARSVPEVLRAAGTVTSRSRAWHAAVSGP